MRDLKFAAGEYYHVCGRGNNKQEIFHNDRDYIRFLAYLLCDQADTLVDIDEVMERLGKNTENLLDADVAERIARDRYVELVGFCLMPNHYHLILLNKNVEGISRYMQRTLNGYTRYSNVKYERVGHVFQGPFKAVRVESNEQLVYLSAYVHLNAKELPGWRDNPHQYPWSSYKDYLGGTTYQGLLKPEIVLGQFDKPSEYHRVTMQSGAKELKLDHMLV